MIGEDLEADLKTLAELPDDYVQQRFVRGPMASSRVNINISDLFFNHDVEVAITRGEKEAFIGFDPERFVEIAGTFLGHLERLGVTDLPTPEELVADYRERL